MFCFVDPKEAVCGKKVTTTTIRRLELVQALDLLIELAK